MLRAANRTLKPGGHLAFTTIALSPQLRPEDLEYALEKGPQHVTAEGGYPELCRRAGFTKVEVSDLTDEYAETAERWMEEWDKEADELEPLLGQDFRDRQSRRRDALPAIQSGLLKRYLVVARKG